jgi:hypothetical protein
MKNKKFYLNGFHVYYLWKNMNGFHIEQICYLSGNSILNEFLPWTYIGIEKIRKILISHLKKLWVTNSFPPWNTNEFRTVHHVNCFSIFNIFLISADLHVELLWKNSPWTVSTLNRFSPRTNLLLERKFWPLLLTILGRNVKNGD